MQCSSIISDVGIEMNVRGDRHAVIDRMLTRYESDIYFYEPSIGFNDCRRTVSKMNSSIPSAENVRANYGIIQVMQSVFMSSHKMSYTSVRCNRFTMSPHSTSSSRGSKEMGEMELMQLYSSGLKHTLAEFKYRGDGFVVKCCSACNCLEIVCMCDEKVRLHATKFECVMSSSSITAIVGMKTASNINIHLSTANEICPKLHPK